MTIPIDLSFASIFIGINILTLYFAREDKITISSWVFVFNYMLFPVIGTYFVGAFDQLGILSTLPSIISASLLLNPLAIIFIIAFCVLLLVILYTLAPPSKLLPSLIFPELTEPGLTIAEILYYTTILSLILIDRYNQNVLLKAAIRGENQYQDLILQSMDPIIVLDQNMVVQEVNKQFEQLSGIKRELLLGTILMKKSDNELTQSIIKLANNILSDGEGEREDKIVMSDSRILYINSRGNLLDDGRIQIILRDKTEKVLSEMELEKTRETMLQNQKMEIVGRLSTNINHDFNNILMSILAIVEYNLQIQDKDDPVYQDFIDIRDVIERASTLTKRLLSFSKHQSSDAKLIDINKSIQGMGTLLENLIGKDRQISYNLTDQDVIAQMDLIQFEQMLLNLVINAKDASARDSILTISTRIEDKIVDPQSFFLHELGKHHPRAMKRSFIVVKVEDQGSGIDHDLISQLFEPFVSMKGTGTGLGLAIVKSIVENYQGHVSVDTEIDQGTIFSIYIPRINSILPESDNSHHTSHHLPNLTILVVDDEDTIINSVVTLLAQQNLETMSASSGTEAQELIKKHHKEIDLIITDIVMPDITGIELVKWLRMEYPDIKAIVMTGYINQPNSSEIDDDISVLSKPFTIEELLTSIEVLYPNNTIP